MERRQLEYLVAVSKAGSLAAAAARLHVSQPALSQAIRQLERAVGCELFHRLPRGMKLTSAGQALVEPAEQVLRDFKTAIAVVDEVRGLQSGRVEIASLPGLVIEPLAGWIRKFNQQTPKVAIRLTQFEESAQVIQSVRSGDVEFGLHLDGSDQGPDITRRRVGTQRLVAVFPPNSIDPATASVTMADLLHVGMIAGIDGSVSRSLLQDVSSGAKASARPIVDVNRRDTALSLILTGVGAGILPSAFGQLAAANGAIVRELEPALSRPIYLSVRNAPLSPAARAFEAASVQVAPPPAHFRTGTEYADPSG